MKKKNYIVYKGKYVLAIALTLLMLLTAVPGSNTASTAKATGSNHKVAIFYGYGGKAGTANPATDVFKNELDNLAYISTAKSGFTDGDFHTTATTGNKTAYGQQNAPAAVKSVDVIYGALKYTFDKYVNNALVYLSQDGTQLEVSTKELNGTKLMKFGGSDAWGAGKTSGLIRFFHIADDLTIVYHYADEVKLSINAGEGADYISDFPGYSHTDDSNVFMGYSRPREIENGFDTSIHMPEGKAIDSIRLRIGANTVTIPEESIQNGVYVNSSYELTSERADAILYYQGDTLKVYKIQENISVNVNDEGIDNGKIISVVGAEGSGTNKPIASTEFQNHVNANGGSVDLDNGIIELNNDYSDSHGLGLTVNAAYGTVSELEVAMGEHTWTLSGGAITAKYISYVNSNYEAIVKDTDKYTDGDLFKYAHVENGKYYSFRFYEIHEDITITVHYQSLQAEIVDPEGYHFISAGYDAVPAGSNALVTDKVLSCSSRYLQRGNKSAAAYSYRAVINPATTSIAGLRVEDTSGMYGGDFLHEEENPGTYDAELGTIKFAYDKGSYFARVFSQTTEKIVFKPILYGDLDRDLKITEEDLIQLRRILAGLSDNTLLADYDQNKDVNVRDIVRMKKNVVQDIKKIVCIGDSITYGYKIGNRTETYPSVLEGLFRKNGQNVEVVNCGKSASYVISPDKRTDVKDEKLWYPNTTEYQRSLVCGADTVVIMLGTNDNRCFTTSDAIKDFKSDLTALIKTYQGLESVKKVYVLSSPPSYINATSNYALDGRIQKLQKEVAASTGATFIDLHSLIFDDITWELTCLSEDKLHPTSKGAAMMANIIYSGITGKKYSGERAPLSTSKDIYVSFANGNDSNDGSEGSPVKTLPCAFVLLRESGGTVHMMDNQTIPDSHRILPRNQKKITITGEGAVLKFAGTLYLHGDVRFENVTIQSSAGRANICCNSHNVEVADNVTGKDLVHTIATTDVGLSGFSE